MKRTFGRGDDSVTQRKKSAFRFPKDESAAFPQAEEPVYIDKRNKNANTDYLIKSHGIKKKNLIQKELIETRNVVMKEAEARGLGLEREDEVIGLDDMNNIDTQMDNFAIEKKKKKKEKVTGMDIDVGEGKSVRTIKNKGKKKKKSKSHYLVNY